MMDSKAKRFWANGSIPLIAPDLLNGIIESASDVAIVISREGQIESVLVNPNHDGRGKFDHWVGRNIRDILAVESIAKLNARLDLIASGAESNRDVELNHVDEIINDCPLRYSFHKITADGTILMMGRDLRQIAEIQHQLVKAQLALEQDYEVQRQFDTRYRVLMESMRDPVIFVSIGSGRIVDVNRAAASILGGDVADLVGSAFAQEFEGRRRGEFIENLTSSAVSDGYLPVELTARRSMNRIMLHPTVFRAAGERLLLCRVELAEAAEKLPDTLETNMGALYLHGIDAIVFVSREGVIEAANPAFLNLVDAPHAGSVIGKPVADFFSRGALDTRVVLDSAARTGALRAFSAKLVSEYGVSIPVELSASYLKDGPNPQFALVIRDANRLDALRKSGVAVTESSVRSVMDLVGSASLKDIVAETADVVEKLCIETAIEMTQNNRVAAAEMLGLSRQSLYVKLRKYGIHGRDGDN